MPGSGLALNPALTQFEFQLKPGGKLAVTMVQKNTGACQYVEIIIDDLRYDQPMARVNWCYLETRKSMSLAYCLYRLINAAYQSHTFWKGETSAWLRSSSLPIDLSKENNHEQSIAVW